MCPYNRCSKTLGRARIAPKRKPTAARSSSATRQSRSLCPMWLRVKRRQSPFHRARGDTPVHQDRRGISRASPTSARAHRDPRPGRPGCEALWTRYVPPALPAQRLRPRSRTSLPLEGRLSLLEECAEALLRIGHREEAILQLAFEGEALVHRHLEAFRDGPLDEANRASGVLRIRQAFCEGHRLVPELRPREDAVEQAPLERFLRGDHAARRHQVDCAALPDQPASSFEAMTHTSTSSSNRTSSIIVFRSRIKSAS